MHSAELLEAYFRYFRTKSTQDRWAAEKVDAVISIDPVQGWELTRVLIDNAQSNEALAFVAAGPLEDLLKKSGPDVMDQIERESLTNDRLQLALSGAWIEPQDAVYERWLALMSKYGFADGKRAAL